MTADERGESVARYLEQLAEKHTARGEVDIQERDYHRSIATLYRARATDVRAELDVPSPSRDLLTGEIILSDTVEV